MYVGRDEDLERLDAHAAGDGPPLVVLGEPGSGKSALVANWAVGYRAAHPDQTVLMHFVGSSPYSSDWRAMLRRIIGEIGRRAGFEEVPDAPDELRSVFARHLRMAAAGGRVILVIDALDQLGDHDGAPDLAWLPPVLPANVRLVVSTLPGRPLAEVQKRGWPMLRVSPSRLTSADADPPAPARAREDPRAGARGPDRLRARCASPLYLRALLEELRLWGVREPLDGKIDGYLGAATTPPSSSGCSPARKQISSATGRGSWATRCVCSARRGSGSRRPSSSISSATPGDRSRGLLVAPLSRRGALALAARRAHRFRPRPASPGGRAPLPPAEWSGRPPTSASPATSTAASWTSVVQGAPVAARRGGGMAAVVRPPRRS